MGALTEPDFRRLWIGQTASAAGDGLTGVALAFAVLYVGGSATDLGLVMAAFMGPRVALMLVGGVWSDRLPRRYVMIGSDLVRAGAQLMLAAAVIAHTSELWPFIVAAAISGGASAFFQPAVVGLIPQTISPQRLQDANALLGVSQWAARLGGPVIAGLAVAAGVLGPLFVVDAVSFAFSALMLARISIRAVPAGEAKSFIDDLRDGWQQVTGRQWLVASLIAFAFANLAYAGLFVLGPVMIGSNPNGAAEWGVLVGVFALGGLAGAAVSMRVRPERPLFAMFLIFLGMPLVLVLLSASPPFGLLALGVFIASAATTLVDTLWHTTLQRQIPSEHLSRVSSVDWTVSMVMLPLGNVAVGPLADSFGTSAALIVIALLAGVPVAVAAFVPSVRRVHGLSTADIAPVEASSRGESVMASEAARP